MLSFSKIASSYVHQRDVSVASMAQYCDTDRSTMYKYISGKRTPPSQKSVEQMADFMKLTPAEKKELIEAYRIALVGEKKHYRRKNIINFFTDYPCDPFDSGMFPFLSPDNANTDALFPNKAANHIPLQNELDIQQVLYQIILRESLRPEGLIQIITQPSWSYLFDLLQSLRTQDSRCQIQHIICMDNNAKADYSKRDYNISYLHSVMSVYQSDAIYKPQYYYDNVDAHFNNLSLFPYLILTSEYALTCSADIHTAILYRDAKTLDMFRTLFEQQYGETSPLFNKVSSNGLEYMKLSQSQVSPDDFSYQLSACPCLLCLADRYFYEKYITDIPEREMLIENLVPYSLLLEELQQKRMLKTCFTMKGLNYFLQTGHVMDIPPSLCHRVEPEDIKILVRKLYNKVADGQVWLLTGVLENLSLSIECLFNSKSGTVITTGKNYKLNYLVFEEQSLINSFVDCFSHLDEMGIAANRESALECLETVLKNI